MKKVLILRAKDDIPRTAKKLRKLGYDVVKSPVLKIVATGATIGPGPYDALLVTSDKGIEFSENAEGFKDLPMHVVGAKTAALAVARGWRVELIAENAESMVSKLFSRYDQPTRFLYLAGHNRKPNLERKLLASGHSVTAAEVYEARAEPKLWKEARASIAERGVKYALHYSRRSASIFLNLARSAKLGKEIADIRHFALSEEVATPLRAAGLDVSTAADPNEDSLLSLLPVAA